MVGRISHVDLDKAEVRGTWREVRLAPSDGSVRRIEAEVVPRRREVIDQRKCNAPTAAADVEDSVFWA
jgi:hypothetical protein